MDTAVAQGRLTTEQGEAIKARIRAHGFPLLPGPPRLPFGPGPVGGPLGAASSYLGLKESELRSRLESGRTLAQVAKAQGKSVDGLVGALVAGARKRLDRAVAAGRLTKAQEREILAHLKGHIRDFVTGRMPQPFRDGDRRRPSSGGPLGAVGQERRSPRSKRTTEELHIHKRSGGAKR